MLPGKKIIESLEDSYAKKPNEWYLLVPANLTTYDWKWWESLKEKYNNVKITIWDSVILEEKVLKHQDKLSIGYTELFPSLDMANKVGSTLLADFSKRFNCYRIK